MTGTVTPRVRRGRRPAPIRPFPIKAKPKKKVATKQKRTR